MKKIKDLCKNQKGQSLVEYLVIVALIGVSTMGVMRAVGQNVNVQFAKVVRALGGEVEGDLKSASVSANAYQKKDFKNFLRGATDGKAKNGSDSSDDQ